jgi:hypothetical protein
MRPTLPTNSENEVWYVVPGRPLPPRRTARRPQTAGTTRSGGKAREASRGSRSSAAPADKSNHGGRVGTGEGDPANPQYDKAGNLR